LKTGRVKLGGGIKKKGGGRRFRLKNANITNTILKYFYIPNFIIMGQQESFQNRVVNLGGRGMDFRGVEF